MLCLTVRAMAKIDLLTPSIEDGDRTVAELCPEINSRGFGYLRAGIRCLASAGWLAAGPTLDPETTRLRWTEEGRTAARYSDRYGEIGDLLARFAAISPDPWTSAWDAETVKAFLRLVRTVATAGLSKANWRLIRAR